MKRIICHYGSGVLAILLLACPVTLFSASTSLPQQLLDEKLKRALTKKAGAARVAALLDKGAQFEQAIQLALDKDTPELLPLLLEKTGQSLTKREWQRHLEQAMNAYQWPAVTHLLDYQQEWAVPDDLVIQALRTGRETIFKRFVERAGGLKAFISLNKKQCLIRAAVNGQNPALLRQLLDTGVGIRCKGVLTSAAHQGNLEIVKLLLATSMNPNGDTPPKHGDSPLLAAIRAGWLPVMNHLLQQGAVLRRKGSEDAPLQIAAQSGHPQIFARLLELDQQADLTPALMAASENGHVSIVKLLQQQGVELNHRFQRTLLEPYSDAAVEQPATTALHLAAQHGHLAVVAYLLEQSVELNPKAYLASDSKQPDITPLHLAIKAEHYAIAKLLVEKGAKLNVLAEQYDTPLSLAVTTNQIEVVRLLLEHDAKYWLWGMRRPPLHAATHNPDMLRFLLNYSWPGSAAYQLAAKDDRGRTALHIAAQQDDVTMVKTLLQRGLSADLMDYAGNTALHQVGDNPAVLELLLEKQRHLGAINRRGETALTRLLSRNKGYYAARLLAAGVNPQLRNNDQQTLLHQLVLTVTPAYQPLETEQAEQLKALPDERLLQLVQAEQDSITYRLEWLLRADLDVNAQDQKGNTVLHYLADSYEKTALLARLLEEEPALDLRNKAGETPLSLAIHPSRPIDIAIQLLEAGANPDLPDGEGESLLFKAISYGQTEWVKALLAAGADINKTNDRGENALFALADTQHSTEMINILLEAGIELDTRNKQGETILHVLSGSGEEEQAVAQQAAFIKRGVDVKQPNDTGHTALHRAVSNNYVSLATLQLRNGANPDAQDTVDGLTPLHYAVRRHNPVMVELLLKHQANPNLSTGLGKTPLHIAVAMGELEIAQQLLAQGARPDSIDLDLRTPLITAVALEQRDIALWLLEQGADVRVASQGGWQALHLAVQQGDAELVRQLLKRGADPAAKLWRGEDAYQLAAAGESPEQRLIGKLLNDQSLRPRAATPEPQQALMQAIAARDLAATQEAVARGAKLNQADKFRRYPLEAAVFSAYQGSDEALPIIRWLLEQGAAINQLTHSGDTPLTLALAENLDFAVAEALLEAGADPNQVKTGRPPLAIAGYFGRQTAALEALLAAGADLNKQHPSGNALQSVLAADPHRTALRQLPAGQKWEQQPEALRRQLLTRARRQHEQLAIYLLERGINTAVDPSRQQWALLNQVVWKAYPRLLEQLLAQKKHTSQQLKNALLNALQMALTQPQHADIAPDIALRLLRALPAHSLANEQGARLLRIACNTNNSFAPVVKQLLAQGALKTFDTEYNLYELLNAALNSGSLHSLDHLLTAKPGLLQQLEQSRPGALYSAALLAEDSQPLVEYLIAQGLPVDARDERGLTPLHKAVIAGAQDTVALLLENGANLHHQDKQGLTVLDQVAFTEPEQAVAMAEYLLAQGADFRQAKAPAVMAVMRVNKELLQFYVRRFRLDLSQPQQGYSLLHTLLKLHLQTVRTSADDERWLPLLQYLLDQGAPVNQRNASILTVAPHSWYAPYTGDEFRQEVLTAYPLELLADNAATKFSGSVLDKLLKAGAETTRTAVDNQGQSLLQRFIESGASVAVLKQLLASGVTADGQDQYGNTVLHTLLQHSIHSGQGEEQQQLIEMLHLLQAKGADFDITNQTGQTALAYWLSRVDPLKNKQALSYIIRQTRYFNNKPVTGYSQRTPALLKVCKVPALLRLMLAQGADPDSTGAYGAGCLHLLAQDLLKDDRREPQAATKDRQYWLAIATLLEYGADPNLQDNRGWSVLRQAVEALRGRMASSSDLQWLEGLLKLTPDFTLADESEAGLLALHRIQDPAVLKLFQRYGARLDARTGGTGYSLLHLSDNPALLRYLLDAGLPADMQDKRGRTPLFMAVESGRRSLIEWWAQAGADFKTLDKQGNTLLHAFARNDYSQNDADADNDAAAEQPLFEYLIDRGVPLNHVNQQGRTVLHGLRQRHQIALILTKGGNINSRDRRGQTLLHKLAIDYQDTALAAWLIKQGAGTNVADQAGETPLFKAAYRGRRDWVALLLKHTANPAQLNQLGDNPLHIALAKNHLQVAERLIQAYSDEQLKIPNWAQKNALQFSFEQQQFGIAKLLASRGLQQPPWPPALAAQRGNPFWLQRSLQADLSTVAAQLLITNEDVDQAEIRRRVQLREFASNNTPLHLAAAQGAVNLFQPLLDNGAQLNALNNNSENAFLVAVKHNQLAAAQNLLLLGAQAQQQDRYGNTALHQAALSGGVALLNEVLALPGSKVNQTNFAGVTPLWLAVQQGNLTAAKFLLAHGANVDQAGKASLTPLLLAAGRADKQMVALLLEHQADIQATDEAKRTPLSRLLYENLYRQQNSFSPEKIPVMLDIMQQLLAQGAELEAKDEHGFTALYLATFSPPLANFLLDQQANVHVEDKEQDTPLFQAIRAQSDAEQVALVARLLDEGAAINHRNQWGETALHKAFRNSNFEVADLLIQRGIDVNVPNRGGYSPLLNIVTHRRFSEKEKMYLTEQLAAHKVDLNQPDQRGYTALHLAINQGLPELAALLLDKGAAVNLKTAAGNTPLHLLFGASYNWRITSPEQRLELAQRMLEQGADLNTINNSYQSLLHLVIGRPQERLLDWVLDQHIKLNQRDIKGNTPLLLAFHKKNIESALKLLAQGANPKLRDQYQRNALDHACLLEDRKLLTAVLEAGMSWRLFRGSATARAKCQALETEAAE